MTTTARTRRPLEDRFWEKVDRREPHECWLWTGAVKDSGYGVFWLEGNRFAPAHRLSLELCLGRPLTADEVARHDCDTPLCVNPGHLVPGTQKQNVDDMIARGRHRVSHGESNGRARLTAEQVAEIRRRHEDHVRALAEEFGVSEVTVYRVLRGATWRTTLQPPKERSTK